jgi:acyl-homoserine lactone synthase
LITIIDRDSYQASADLLDRIYCFRHRLFVETMRWEACRKPDGRERDQFDGPDCIHVAGIDDGEVVSYSRLLPTTRPHLQSHVYPELLQGAKAPSGPRLFEWTRCGAAPWRRASATAKDPVAGRQFVAVAELTGLLGLDGYLIQAHPIMITHLATLGWETEPLALPMIYDGNPLVAFLARWTPATADTTRAVFELAGTPYDVPRGLGRASLDRAERILRAS